MQSLCCSDSWLRNVPKTQCTGLLLTHIRMAAEAFPNLPGHISAPHPDAPCSQQPGAWRWHSWLGWLFLLSGSAREDGLFPSYSCSYSKRISLIFPAWGASCAELFLTFLRCEAMEKSCFHPDTEIVWLNKLHCVKRHMFLLVSLGFLPPIYPSLSSLWPYRSVTAHFWKEQEALGLIPPRGDLQPFQHIPWLSYCKDDEKVII